VGVRPRLHAVIDVTSAAQAAEWAGVAFGSDLDGVFLISHARDDAELVSGVRAVRAAFPWGFLGVNVIGRGPADSLRLLDDSGVVEEVDALWTDSAGADLEDVDVRAEAFRLAKEATAWKGVHFGGVAFKYQPDVDPAALAALAARAAAYVDVVTTSGAGTGQAIDRAKLATFSAALGQHPLALASGVTPENVHEVRDHVKHILVSTGIKGDDGTFDPTRIEALRRAVR
jgi:hypothetical protein